MKRCAEQFEQIASMWPRHRIGFLGYERDRGLAAGWDSAGIVHQRSIAPYFTINSYSMS